MSVGSEAVGDGRALGTGRRFASRRRSLRRIACWINAGLANDQVWLLSIVCAAIFQFSLIATHRPWLDEWQALLISRQTPTLASMFAQLHYEGHPQLWYLLLRAVGDVVPTEWVLRIVSLTAAAVTWWAILVRAPFMRLHRLLLVLSEIFLLEMLGVSRSLALGVALVFLALALWRRPTAWFPLALLPLCDFFFGVIACILIFVRLRDRRDRSLPYAGLILFAVCGVLAAWGVMPAHDVLTDPPLGWFGGAIEFAEQLGTLLVPLQIEGYDLEAPGLAWVFVAPAFLYVCAATLKTDRVAQMLLFAFMLLLLVFCCFIYPMYLRHTALAALLFVALTWICAEQGMRVGRAFSVWLWLGAICGLLTGMLNLVVPFDTAKAAASVIHRQKLERKLWFSFPAYRGIALAGESGIVFGNLEQDCGSQFMRWNFRTRIKTHAQLYRALSAAENRYGSFYFVTDVREPLPSNLGHLIAKVPAGYDGQPYNLWQIGHGTVLEQKLRPCVPGIARWTGVSRQ